MAKCCGTSGTHNLLGFFGRPQTKYIFCTYVKIYSVSNEVGHQTFHLSAPAWPLCEILQPTGFHQSKNLPIRLDKVIFESDSVSGLIMAQRTVTIAIEQNNWKDLSAEGVVAYWLDISTTAIPRHPQMTVLKLFLLSNCVR